MSLFKEKVKEFKEKMDSLFLKYKVSDSETTSFFRTLIHDAYCEGYGDGYKDGVKNG